MPSERQGQHFQHYVHPPPVHLPPARLCMPALISLTLAGGGPVPVDTKVILSSHNFEETPTDAALENTLQQMWACGADIAKIATTATDIVDCARVLTLLKTSQGKHAGHRLVLFHSCCCISSHIKVVVMNAACFVWTAAVRCCSIMTLTAMFVLGLGAELLQLTVVVLPAHDAQLVI